MNVHRTVAQGSAERGALDDPELITRSIDALASGIDLGAEQTAAVLGWLGERDQSGQGGADLARVVGGDRVPPGRVDPPAMTVGRAPVANGPHGEAGLAVVSLRRRDGAPHGSAWASRTAAIAYGTASALTLDEFALWLDLHDDYWDAQGRKSIDAVIVFAGLLTMTYAAQDALDELGLIPKLLKRR